MGNIQESPAPYRTPEGLTYNQEILAGMLFDTSTLAPADRLHFNSDGSHTIYKVEGRNTSPIDFAQDPEEHAFKHHEENPHAPLAPVKVNLRNLPSDVLMRVGIVYSEIPETNCAPDLCAGIPEAGIPLAQAYGIQSGVEVSEVFKKVQDGEKRKIIPGEIDGGKRKLRIIDDTATGGGSKFEAIEAAESLGFEVSDITVLIDRSQGAKEMIEEHGYEFRSAFTLIQLLQFGLRTGRISQEQFSSAQDYILSQKQAS